MTPRTKHLDLARHGRDPDPSFAPGRSHSRPGSFFALVAAVALIVGCSTPGSLVYRPPIAPGNDPVQVETERVMRATVATYDHVMTWCEDNRANVGASVLSACKLLRDKTPVAYRAVDQALELYITTKKIGDLLGLRAKLEDLVSQLLALGSPAPPKTGDVLTPRLNRLARDWIRVPAGRLAEVRP